MKELFIFSCNVTESNGKRRINEYCGFGVVDDEGNFRLKQGFGYMYPSWISNAANDYKISNFIKNNA